MTDQKTVESFDLTVTASAITNGAKHRRTLRKQACLLASDHHADADAMGNVLNSVMDKAFGVDVKRADADADKVGMHDYFRDQLTKALRAEYGVGVDLKESDRDGNGRFTSLEFKATKAPAPKAGEVGKDDHDAAESAKRKHGLDQLPSMVDHLLSATDCSAYQVAREAALRIDSLDDLKALQQHVVDLISGLEKAAEKAAA